MFSSWTAPLGRKSDEVGPTQTTVRPAASGLWQATRAFDYAQGKASVLPRQQKQKRPTGIFQAGRFELN